MDALLPDRTSSATTRASRSGNILANIVWLRSIEPRRDGSDLGLPDGETPAALNALSSNDPILSTESRLPTRSATSSKGSRSWVATAAMDAEGCWWLRSPVGAPRFASPRSFAVFEVGEDLPSFVASRVLVTPAFFFADWNRYFRPPDAVKPTGKPVYAHLAYSCCLSMKAGSHCPLPRGASRQAPIAWPCPRELLGESDRSVAGLARLCRTPARACSEGSESSEGSAEGTHWHVSPTPSPRRRRPDGEERPPAARDVRSPTRDS